MPKLTIFEKFDILLDNVLANPLFLILLIVPVVALIINKTKFKKFAVIFYIIATLLIFALNYKYIFVLFDNLTETIVTALMFPTIGLVLAVVIAELVIMLMTIAKNYRTPVKIINSISFVFIQIMFAIVLKLTENSKIDLSKTDSIYNSIDLGTVMQMMMLTFGLQLVLLLVSKSIDKVTLSLDNTKVKETHADIADTKLELELPEVTDEETLVPAIVTETEPELLLEPINFEESYENIFNKKPEVNKTMVLNRNINTTEKPYIKTMETNKEVSKTLNTKKPIVRTMVLNKDIITSEKPYVKTMATDKEISKTLTTKKPYVKTMELDRNMSKNITTKDVIGKDKYDEIINNYDKLVASITPAVTIAHKPISKKDIANIADRVENIEETNKFISEDNKKQLEEELLAYKEQLIEYKENQIKKQNDLRKEMEAYTNIFGISADDFRY